jgi:RNA polymerase sigma factor (sigma-70 family)
MQQAGLTSGRSVKESGIFRAYFSPRIATIRQRQGNAAQSGEQIIEHEVKLVQAARAGDLDSFGKLCEQYYAPLAAIAYSALRDHQLAEDAAQEAFARALVSLAGLKEPGKFAPWLAQICRNAAADIARARRPRVNAGELTQTPCRDTDDCASQIVRQAIDRLPVSLREVVILRYHDDCSYEQISGVLGLSKTAINGRLTRAKRKLARYLCRQGVLEDMP